MAYVVCGRCGKRATPYYLFTTVEGDVLSTAIRIKRSINPKPLCSECHHFIEKWLNNTSRNVFEQYASLKKSHNEMGRELNKAAALETELRAEISRLEAQLDYEKQWTSNYSSSLRRAGDDRDRVLKAANDVLEALPLCMGVDPRVLKPLRDVVNELYPRGCCG